MEIEEGDLVRESSFGISGNETETSDWFPYYKVLWTAAFTPMLSTAFYGNIIVIWIILAHRSMRTVTNYFIFNLSVADLTMATLNGAPNFIYMIHGNWILGNFLCIVNNFVANFTVASCVFTMMAISIDRYQAIVRPLEPRLTKRSALIAIGTIWVCSALLALPCLIYSSTIVYNQPNGALSLCIIQWPDLTDDLTESKWEFIYNVCLLVLTYVLPMVAMGFCYGLMSLELWGVRQIGENSEFQRRSIASKRKVVRMFIVLVATFGVCWLPYHAYFIYKYCDNSIVYKQWIVHLYLSFYWLAMATSMINPILYYFFNARFRRFFKSLLCSRCSCSCCTKDERVTVTFAETPVIVRRISTLRNGAAPDMNRNRYENRSTSGPRGRSENGNMKNMVVRNNSSYC